MQWNGHVNKYSSGAEGIWVTEAPTQGPIVCQVQSFALTFLASGVVLIVRTLKIPAIQGPLKAPRSSAYPGLESNLACKIRNSPRPSSGFKSVHVRVLLQWFLTDIGKSLRKRANTNTASSLSHLPILSSNCNFVLLSTWISALST